MKHNTIITLTIIFFFITTQILGIIVLEELKTQNAFEKIQITQNLKYNNIHNIDYNIIIAIILGILIGFLLIKILIKTKQKNLWIILYYYITYTLLYTTINVFLNKTISTITALTLIIIKNLKKTPQIVKNFIETLFYPAFAILFSPLLTPITAIILLIIISFYDMYMVWKSKEMIKLAEFQLKTKFTGILIEYEEKTKEKEKIKTKLEEQKYKEQKILKDDRIIRRIERKNVTKKINTKQKNIKQKEKNEYEKKENKIQENNTKEKIVRKAILGGGDLAFTTMYTGTIYLHLGINIALLTIIFSTIGLAYLFIKSEKGKMYPAMPYITFFTIIPTITYYILQVI